MRGSPLPMWAYLMATAAFPPQTGWSPTSVILLTSTGTGLSALSRASQRPSCRCALLQRG